MILSKVTPMKRIGDILFSVLLLLILAIPFALIGTLVLITDGSPVFFRQVRIGRNLNPFIIWKFRTMHRDLKEEYSLTIGSDSRITPLGRWLRRRHLDELPQLFNILRGEMSFIGPRPEIPEFIDPNDPLHQNAGRLYPGLFDPATFIYFNEADVLAKVDDWHNYYSRVILPNKLKRSLQYAAIRTWKSDILLLFYLIYRLTLVHRTSKIYDYNP